MAFIKRLWKDRISEYPNRRTVNDGYVTKQVTVGRDEGNITEAGDSFDASNMNDLEQRIEDAYGDVQALVGSEVAAQYNQDNVIFDPVATEGHGTGFVVSSDYIAKLEVGDLADTDISGQAQGEALVWDGSKWVNGTVSTVGNLDDLNDVDTTGKASGDSLRYDGADWIAQPTTVTLTQAEYDALQLSGDLVPNTHYVITDAPNLNATASDIEYSSGVSVKQAIDGVCNYSTTETAIGKWIDGRTVYQKVILINDTISNNWENTEIINGITRIVGAEFVVYEGGNRGSGVRQGMFAEISTITPYLVQIFNNTGYSIQVDYLILKYIKN